MRLHTLPLYYVRMYLGMCKGEGRGGVHQVGGKKKNDGQPLASSSGDPIFLLPPPPLCN